MMKLTIKEWINTYNVLIHGKKQFTFFSGFKIHRSVMKAFIFHFWNSNVLFLTHHLSVKDGDLFFQGRTTSF